MALFGNFQQRRCSWPLLYYFVGSNIVLWYLAGSAAFYALMATNVRKKPVIFTMDDSVADARYPFGRDRTERPP
jgi:hypothetical protein